MANRLIHSSINLEKGKHDATTREQIARSTFKKARRERESRSAGDGALVVPPSVNLSGKKSKEKKQQKGKRQTHNFDCGQHILINASAERARKGGRGWRWGRYRQCPEQCKGERGVGWNGQEGAGTSTLA